MTGTTTLMHNQQANGMMGLNPMMAEMGAMQSMQMPMGMAGMQGMGGDIGAQYIPVPASDMTESGINMPGQQDASNYGHIPHNSVNSDHMTQVG